MALITCPHCGNQVSDTVERCVHCGELIKEKPPEPKRYADLSMAEKDSLDAEFERAHPEYSMRRVAKKQIILLVIMLVSLVILAVLVGVYSAKNQSQSKENERIKTEFYETHGKHFQGHHDVEEFTNMGWVMYRGDETILFSEEELSEYNSILAKQNEENISSAIQLATFFVILILCFIIARCRYSVNLKKIILYKKLYKAWLFEYKQVIYQPILSQKDKKRFDSFEISNYKL